MNLVPERYRVLRDLQYTSDRMEQFNAISNIAGRGVVKALRDRVTLVMKNPDGREIVMPFDAGGERFSEFIIFQRELQKIINQRIDEVRGHTGKVLNWLTRKRPVGGKFQFTVYVDPIDGNHGFSAHLSRREVAIRMQAEAVYIDSLKKQGDIETLRRFFMRNSSIASQLGYEIAILELLQPENVLHLDLPGLPNYFNRPDLFGKFDEAAFSERPSSENP